MAKKHDVSFTFWVKESGAMISKVKLIIAYWGKKKTKLNDTSNDFLMRCKVKLTTILFDNPSHLSCKAWSVFSFNQKILINQKAINELYLSQEKLKVKHGSLP